MTFRYHFVQHASRRAADWKERGFTETLVDFPTLNARSKFWGDDQRAAFKNWEAITDIRNPLGERQGIDERVRLRELLRRVDLKVILGNHLDVLVRLHTSLPPLKIGLAPEPAPQGGCSVVSLRYGPNAGETEVLIPGGLCPRGLRPGLRAERRQASATSPKPTPTPTMLPAPGLPFSLVFRAEPGAEDRILKVAAAYQKASHARVPPPGFPAIPGAKSRRPSGSVRPVQRAEGSGGSGSSPLGFPFVPGVALDRDSGTREAQHVDRIQLAASARGERPGLDDQRGMPGNLIPLRCVAHVAHVEMAGQKEVGAGGRELLHRHV